MSDWCASTSITILGVVLFLVYIGFSIFAGVIINDCKCLIVKSVEHVKLFGFARLSSSAYSLDMVLLHVAMTMLILAGWIIATLGVIEFIVYYNNL